MRPPSHYEWREKHEDNPEGAADPLRTSEFLRRKTEPACLPGPFQCSLNDRTELHFPLACNSKLYYLLPTANK